MAFTANAIGRVRPSGNDANGAFFDPSLCTLTDLAATSGTTTAPVVTSASYTFVSGDVGAYVFVKSGTNWTPGWYAIASVNAGAATLTATVGSVRLYSGDYSQFNTSAGCATTGSPTGGTWSVDYSQQNAAQASASAGTSNASTTFTDAGALFTVAMIGNALRLASGTNGTVGYYFITAVGSTTSITLDRNSSTAAMTNGVWKIGGACATIARTLENGNATGDKAVPGNTVYIYGAGSDSPSAADYTFTGYTTPVSGSSSGMVRIIGENGRPRLQGNGLMFYTSTSVHFENLYLTTSSNNAGTLGVIHTSGSGSCLIKNIVINTNNKTSMVGIYTSTNTNGPRIVDTEIYGGTTPATFSAGCHGVACNAYSTCLDSCNIHRCRDTGIYAGHAGANITVRNSKVNKNAGDGIYIQGTATAPNHIDAVTIDGNLLHGVNIATSAALANTRMINCNITNHTVASKYGINMGAGTAAVNDTMAGGVNYNNLYNNTSNRNNLSAAANDQSVDPGYVDSENGNYAIGTALKALGFPGLLRNSAAIESTGTTLYVDIGAQRQEAGGGGTTGGYVIGS